jgi:hypothetical protein
MSKVKLSDLVLDFDLYPRSEIDSQHVRYMRMALQAGAAFPDILADKKSRRVIDGFHRYCMYRAENGEECEVNVTWKSYGSEAEMFLEAVRLNASHGRILTRFDRTHCILRAERFRIEPEQIATALSITCEAVGGLRADRVGHLRAVGNAEAVEIPLKRTIAHMAGKMLTKGQNEANDKLGGMNQAFYVNQVIVLIESHLLDEADENLMERLRRLAELLETVIAVGVE